ncbi:cell division protein SepF [Nanobdella aerobiophila]|uniref:Cell division protein SepF n=1 Tax=Nanobdella aerobiophila TaxID=2586965 RepID=A0A915WSC3_9ARCH|nr:cell division protein SepF [Nanobdella aerobiophila]BBL45791.1 cell division protein SepF [Nanobdella aerobiophila]
MAISFKNIFKGKKEENTDQYVEVVPTQKAEEVKIYVRVFRLKDPSEVKAVVDSLRERNFIVFVDLSNLNASKDLIEAKRVVSRIKSVVDAVGGDIVAVNKDWIIATPAYVKIWRGHQMSAVEDIKGEENAQ